MSSISSTASKKTPLSYFDNYIQQEYQNSDIGSCKMKRLLAESVEVAIALCHRYLGSIGNVKVLLDNTTVLLQI